MLIHDAHHLVMPRRQRTRKLVEPCQGNGTQLPFAHRDLADHIRVRCDFIMFKEFAQRRYSSMQVVQPDGGIDQDQIFDLRRGGSFNPGALPPRRANLRPASRAIKAFSPSRTKADFSVRPVYSLAVSIKSSSNTNVVRIGSPLARIYHRLMLSTGTFCGRVYPMALGVYIACVNVGRLNGTRRLYVCLVAKAKSVRSRMQNSRSSAELRSPQMTILRSSRDAFRRKRPVEPASVHPIHRRIL
jgi:hypothetical protein